MFRMERPNWIQIEVTNRCNLSCTMCPRNYLNIDIVDMHFDVYKAVIQKLHPGGLVSLVGLGEPLMHRRIFDMVRYAKDHDHEVSITTNGFLLNQHARREIVDTKLDYLRISVDEASPGEQPQLNHPYNAKVFDNVRELLKLRENGSQPHIMFNVVVSRLNTQIVPDIIHRGHELDIDAVNLIKLAKSGHGLERLTLYEEERLFKLYHQLGDELGLEIRSTYVTKDDLPPICPFFANFLYVNVHGQATPCCHLGESAFAVGNLLEDPADEIWNGEAMRKFWQKDSKTLCQDCHLMLWKNEGEPIWSQNPELIFADEPNPVAGISRLQQVRLRLRGFLHRAFHYFSLSNLSNTTVTFFSSKRPWSKRKSSSS
jgi:radical SAM protein with 4Fe4S-binding SPASM domain